MNRLAVFRRRSTAIDWYLAVESKPCVVRTEGQPFVVMTTAEGKVSCPRLT